MKLKDILRNWVIAALSQPKNKVSVELSKIQYGSILKGAANRCYRWFERNRFCNG